VIIVADSIPLECSVRLPPVSYPFDLKSMTSDEFQAFLDEVELHRMIGMSVEGWEDRSIAFKLAPPGDVRDPRTGGVHGGVLATAIDTAAGFAATLASGFDIATVDLRIDYIRPALDAQFRVVGRSIRSGERFGWAEATVSTLEDRAVALGRGTFTW
jgi:uncharacterized protein (TIGR00369 family)